jgi:hypothetical protein
VHSRIEALSGESQERIRLHATALQDLNNLEARIQLRAIITDVSAYVGRAKWTQKANQSIRSFASVLRSLTLVASQASSDLLNSEFESLFAKECTRLRAPNVGLYFPGRRGQATRSKVLYEGHRISDILSEGEQKVIAIADFLAEAAIGSRKGPVIFDDPTNSLDHRRLHEIANRIINLVRSTQVIVFTHDIWLATELLSKRSELGADGCSFFEIREADNRKGVISAGSHPRWDTPRILQADIDDLIGAANTSDGAVKEALIERAYDKFRAWCEVVVEQDLLAKVSQRYQPNIQMGSIRNIHIEKLQDAIDAIFPLWEKANRYITGHSQPLQTLGVRPQVSELETDWSVAQRALRAYRSSS